MECVALTISVLYDGLEGLRHDYETQLRMGGFYAGLAAPQDLEPLAEVDLCLEVEGREPIRTRARLTVATAEALCVEIFAEARAELGAAIEAVCAGVAAAPPARRDVRLSREPAAPAAAAPAAPATTAAPAAPRPARVAPERLTLAQRINLMSVSEKMQLAMSGDRESRNLLARDRAAPVQAGLVRNPRLTLDEATAVARNPQLAGEAAEALAQHPSFGTQPQIALALVRNPRTPLTLAISLVGRLNQTDLRMVAKGVSVRTQVAAAARKRLFNA
jgi:hypothetical protein